MQEQEESEMLAMAPRSAMEEELVNEGTAKAIQELRLRGKSKKAIARELGLDIKTVRKWSKEEWAPQRRQGRENVLTPYAELIRGRFPEVGYNAAVLDRELRAAGYEGSYPTVQRFVRSLRSAAQPEQATVRFETGPGEQAQVDWGMLNVWLGESRIKVHLFVMVLGYSRRIFTQAYLHERLSNLLAGHEAAFSHLGGRTEKILYDNPRTIVLSKDESSGAVEWNRRFKERMDFYGVDIRLCRYYRAQTKGKVESGVKYVKRNALAGRRFQNLEGLNAWLTEWSLTIADQRIHGTTHERPAERFDRDERARMVPTDARPPARDCKMVRRRVSFDGFVEVETNRYPVPYEWCRAEVDVELTESNVRIVHEAAMLVYERESERHRVVRWNGALRSLTQHARHDPPNEPPRFDPVWLASVGQVSTRSLEAYAALAEEVVP